VPVTQTDDRDEARTPQRRRRTEIDLAEAQLRGIEQFNRSRRMREVAAGAVGLSREARMDSARELEVIRREHDALVARAQEQLETSGTHPLGTAGRTVVIAHRNEWFVGKVADALRERGYRVLSHVENGADAVGTVVAEQPDLVLVEDQLAMIPGEDVVRQIRALSPDTIIAAQVPYGDRVGALLEAGAATVLTRQVPPAEVADALLRLLEA
jgi:CheY-like chemotaxis protein